MAMIQANIARVQGEINAVLKRLRRDPQDITLVCVTKYATPSMIDEALGAGISHIGENKVQEASEKFFSLKPGAAVWHMIGHLQTNKVKDALKIFNVIQSLDSEKLARAINAAAAKLKLRVDILVQVNTAQESQKYGISCEGTVPLIKEGSRMENLRVLGLMAMAPATQDLEIVRSSFSKLRLLRDQVQNEVSGKENVQMKYLSMGMSSDYKIALEEGSNMIRVGRAIFG